MKGLSMRKAINLMCKNCIYDETPGNGTWRQQVEACTATSCPLYPLRPVTIASEDKRAAENKAAKETLNEETEQERSEVGGD